MASLPEVPALIPLRNRKQEVTGYALVDEADAVLIRSKTWYLDTLGYAVTGSRRCGCTRFLLQPESGFEVDHINGNKLDNRRANLRVVTHAQNAQNHHSRQGQSEHRGVYYDRRHDRWYGQVKHQGKRHCTASCGGSGTGR